MPKYSQGSPNRYPNQSFVAVMTTADRTGGKSTIGTMIYDSDLDELFIYTASGWKSVELTA